MTLDLSSVGRTFGPFEQTYDWRDLALYALGLGAGTGDLDYVLDEPPPKVLPTFGVVPAFKLVSEALAATGGDLVTLLHSGQRTEVLAPFPPAGRMLTRAQIHGIWDMKLGALVSIQTTTEVNGEATARTDWHLLLRGAGGFGGERPPKLLRTRQRTEEPPLFCAEVTTSPSQALLYRLCGDTNPIHSHPEAARQAGFGRPILHGLCFYGIAGRMALKHLLGDDVSRVKALEARFASTVMPGDTLVVEGWKLEEPGTAALTVTVKATGEKAIANCLLEYR